jgi:hypothetical protein
MEGNKEMGADQAKELFLQAQELGGRFSRKFR